MSLFLLDTDTLSLLQRGLATVWQHVDGHPSADIAVSAISIQEQMKGSLGAIGRARNDDQLEKAYDMLVTRLLPTWARFSAISFTKQDMQTFQQLLSRRLNVGPMDLRIAATALERNLTVVTRNKRDFGRVVGLKLEDWSI